LLNLVDMRARHHSSDVQVAEYTREWTEHFETDIEDKKAKIEEYDAKIASLEERQTLRCVACRGVDDEGYWVGRECGVRTGGWGWASGCEW
jgi:hypothetical protein